MLQFLKLKLLNNVFSVACVLMISFFLMPQICSADYDYIKISDPFLNKIPVAVPVFKSLSGTSDEKEISITASDLVYNALAFTGYFRMIDREAFLEDLQVKGITGPDINFDNWTDIGAELLITGGVSITDDHLQIEFRLFDTFKSELLFGKLYKGRLNDQRKIVHRFCSEMVYRLTGKRGIFESMIAFVSTTTGNKEIFICEFDGYDVNQVTRTKSLTLFPAWSPDGSSIAYTSYKNDKPEIFIRHLRDGKETKISFDGMNISPVWMPGQKLLGATLSFEGDEEIYLLTESGKIDKRLTKNWGIDVSPTFSPDGKKMAFVSKRFGSPQIFIQDIDTGATRRLTYDGKYNTQPDWSPAGDRIVYSGMENGQANIFVINADGKDPKQLTSDTGSNESPSWSPDGSLIAFSSTRKGKARIYIMTASGTDQRMLLELSGEQTDPAWSTSFKEY
jgi:TolB protein